MERETLAGHVLLPIRREAGGVEEWAAGARGEGGRVGGGAIEARADSSETCVRPYRYAICWSEGGRGFNLSFEPPELSRRARSGN